MRRFAMAAAALAIVAAACNGTTGSADTTLGTYPDDAPAQAVPAAYGLQAFDACDDFLDYVKQYAVDLVGPWGFETGWYGPMVGRLAGDGVMVMEDMAATDGAAGGISPPTTAAATTVPAPGVDYSATNVQELGVDEPDIVKTDGNRIVVMSGSMLSVVDVSGGEPLLAGQLELDSAWASNLFLAGDRILVLAADDPWAYAGGVTPDAWYPTPVARLIEVDISDVANPRVVRTLHLDGATVSARMVGNTVRVVVSSLPTGLAFQYPETSGLKAERDAAAHNRQVVLDSTIENWVPYYVLEDATGRVVREGSLLDCSRASHPREFSGLSMLSVITIDLGNSMTIDDAVGVLAEGSIVYSSEDAMYVASSAWRNWEVLDAAAANAAADQYTTDIHKFDISDPSHTTYEATGQVTGFMLSQWSMSEYDGYLRVASTTTPSWWGGDRRSESFVTVLEQRDGELVQVGKVGGLGAGEQIFSVRFIDDIGYVVTFRQTDPLYTIDLSDPTAPTVAGELKLLGYSAYLHPLGDGLLLGVGQDATEEGRTQGTQVSVFDVSDISDPRRLDNYTLDNGYSSAEYDHHAFLYWPDTGLTVIPVQVWKWDEDTETESGFSGAIALDAGREGITEIGRITHGDSGDEAEYWMNPPIQRSLVIGDSLYTVSDQGVLQSDLTTAEPGTFVELWQ
jgi:hypothetical protein